MNFQIGSMVKSDWEQVSAIYWAGILTGIATFDKTLPEWAEWDSSHCKSCRIVAHEGRIVLGWAALTPVSGRCVYSGVAEVSIYVHQQYKGRGIGTALLQELIRGSEKEGFWTLQASIIADNNSSIELHKRCGFRVVGVREKLGKTDSGHWHDVIMMERRSKCVGIDESRYVD